MRRGDVYMADLDPIKGSETSKIRPVVLVARNDALAAVQRHRQGFITVVPMTLNARIYGRMHILIEPSPLNGLLVASKAQTEQVRSIDVSRVGRRTGQLTPYDLEALENALRYQLAL